MTMLRQLLAFAALLVLSTCSGTVDAARIYSLVDYPDLQNGHTLTGTITVTDDAPDDGLLSLPEIVDWHWLVTGPNTPTHATFDQARYDPGAATPSTAVDGILITQSAIELPVGVDAEVALWQTVREGRGARIILQWGNAIGSAEGQYLTHYFAGYMTDVPHAYWSGSFDRSVVGTWTIARAIPEPPMRLGAALALGLIAAWRLSLLMHERGTTTGEAHR